MAWNEALDLIVKIVSALSIIAGIAIALRQIASARRAAALTIGRNHHLELNKLLFQHAELAARGSTAESFELLKSDLPSYLQYIWLASMVIFSCQETFFLLKDDEITANRLTITLSLFRYFAASTDLASTERRRFKPEFLTFLQDAVTGPEHPIADIVRRMGPLGASGAENHPSG